MYMYIMYMIKMHFFPEKCKFYQKVCKIKKKIIWP